MYFQCLLIKYDMMQKLTKKIILQKYQTFGFFLQKSQKSKLLLTIPNKYFQCLLIKYDAIIANVAQYDAVPNKKN